MAARSSRYSLGGDPDNYTYPRHNLDFSLFRVYENGKPYRPAAFLPFSQKGAAIGDLTFISGHPAPPSGSRPTPRWCMRGISGFPSSSGPWKRHKKPLQALAATSPEARRLAADAIYGIENGFKRLSGQLLGLKTREPAQGPGRRGGS